jgi:hypothetical protein
LDARIRFDMGIEDLIDLGIYTRTGDSFGTLSSACDNGVILGAWRIMIDDCFFLTLFPLSSTDFGGIPIHPVRVFVVLCDQPVEVRR